MMLGLLLVALFALTEGRLVIQPCGDSIHINNIVYKKEVLKNNVDSPYQLAIDHDTNTLFFSYTANTDQTFETMYINLKDKTSGLVRGVAGGFANAVDKDRQIVYIGGRDGIYKFNYDTKKAEKLDITNENIWQLFYKDGLYFTTYPEEKVYLYKNGIVSPVRELEDSTAKLVAVDNNKNLYYFVNGELHKIAKGVDSKLGDYSLNALSTDVHGNVYFSTPDGIYIIKDNVINKVTYIENLFGFALESDDSIVYADRNKIIKLTPTNEMCYDSLSPR